MEVTVFKRKGNSLIESVQSSFIKGVENLGLKVKIRAEHEYDREETDIAVVYSQYKRKLHSSSYPRLRIYQQHPRSKLIVLERGYLRRDKYHSVGIGGVNGNATFPIPVFPSSERFDKLGLEVKQNTSGENILVAGQVPWDSTVQHVDYVKWVHGTLRELSSISFRKIVWRPHPLQKNAIKIPNDLKNVVTSTKSLEEDLAEAHACVTFCSNTSVDAVLAGVPIFVMDPNGIAWEVANKNLKDIECPKQVNSMAFLNRLSFCQWSLEELESGKCFKLISNYLGRPYV